MRLTVGQRVVFSEQGLAAYRAVYSIGKDDVFTVAHVENRHGGKKVFYLARTERGGDWLPVYRKAISTATGKRKRRAKPRPAG